MGLGAMVVSFMGSQNPFARWLFVVGLVFLGIGLLAAAGSQAVERGRRPSLPFRGPSPVLAFAAVVVVTLLATLVTLAPLSALGPRSWRSARPRPSRSAVTTRGVPGRRAGCWSWARAP